jgi:two-component SAPR family response regulator
MIADTNMARGKEFQNQLKASGYFQNIEIYNNAEKLLAQVLRRPPHFVFFYVGEQGLNAFSAAKQIQKMSPITKIAFMSDKREYALLTFEIGADCFLLYPPDEKQLERALTFLKKSELPKYTACMPYLQKVN